MIWLPSNWDAISHPESSLLSDFSSFLVGTLNKYQLRNYPVGDLMGPEFSWEFGGEF